MGGWPHPSTRAYAYLLEVVSTGSISPSLCMTKVHPCTCLASSLSDFSPIASNNTFTSSNTLKQQISSA